MVQNHLEPIVRAMKQYEAVNGVRPNSSVDLYGPNMRGSQGWYASGVHGGEFEFRDTLGFIRYDFTPEHEGWSVGGPFTKGRIPLPPVTLKAPAATSHS